MCRPKSLQGHLVGRDEPDHQVTAPFGLLAVELAITMSRSASAGLAVVFFGLSLIFVYRSFYGMRIPLQGK